MAKRETRENGPNGPDLSERREVAATVSEAPPIQPYPKMKYHAVLRGCIVQTAEEEAALAEGWVDTLDQVLLAPTPTVTALEPPTVALGAPSFVVTVRGTGFEPGAVILWNGSAEPTTYTSATEVSTGVNMATAGAAVAIPVAVENPDGAVSNALAFTFTDPGAVSLRQKQWGR